MREIERERDKRHDMSLQISGTYSISPCRERDTVCVCVCNREKGREGEKEKQYL